MEEFNKCPSFSCRSEIFNNLIVINCNQVVDFSLISCIKPANRCHKNNKHFLQTDNDDVLNARGVHKISTCLVLFKIYDCTVYNINKATWRDDEAGIDRMRLWHVMKTKETFLYHLKQSL